MTPIEPGSKKVQKIKRIINTNWADEIPADNSENNAIFIFKIIKFNVRLLIINVNNCT